MVKRTPTSGSVGRHPFAHTHLQTALAALWEALDAHEPLERRFRRRGRRGKHIEFIGRNLDDYATDFWLLREGDVYWLMSDWGFLNRVERYFEDNEIGPNEPGGWGNT